MPSDPQVLICEIETVPTSVTLQGQEQKEP